MSAWTPDRAREHLLSLELFGMRFGLDRMRRLMTALGSPQRRFESIHVVGTNGKSSTVRMIAAILERQGLRTGAYLSPHLRAFSERVRVGDRDLDPAVFAAAVQRAAGAAAKVDRTLSDDDRVTQFELLTAAAYDALASAGVQVAVVEAGLGGRYDATNVLDSRVAVLTNVGLDHTRWLGPTISDIAREKLAVLAPGATLVTGPLAPEAAAQARAAADERAARLLTVSEPTELELAARGSFQRANFALATCAAQALLDRRLDDAAMRDAAATTAVPGRCELVGERPLTILDGAHNPAGVKALTASLPDLVAVRPLTAVVSILDDKDAAGMLRVLLPCCAALVLTSNASPRALSPATLESLARQIAPERPECHSEPDPRQALARARAPAGPDGAVLATGSIYLVADLKAPASAAGQVAL